MSSSLRPVAPDPRPVTPPGNQQVPPPEEAVVFYSRNRAIGGSFQPHHSLAGTGPKKRSSESSSELGGSTVRERNRLMLFNDEMSDVRFILTAPCTCQQHLLSILRGSPKDSQENVSIAAHSYVLATGSSVFYAMFHGPLQRACSSSSNSTISQIITIPDVEPCSFKVMLRYLYTDEVQLCWDTALATLYTSKKYMVDYLSQACIQFLHDSLSAENVCQLLIQSELFEENDLLNRCWELIDVQCESVLLSEGFLDLDRVKIESILERDTLVVKESNVFEALIRWARAEAERRKIENSSNHRLRKILGETFNQIRFPAMGIQEFANGPAQSKILTSEEINEIFLWFAADDKPSLPYVQRSRGQLEMKRCHRFQSSAYRSNQWRYRGRCDSIQFVVDSHIFVAGFGLYGSGNGSAEYRVKIELKRVPICPGSGGSFLDSKLPQSAVTNRQKRITENESTEDPQTSDGDNLPQLLASANVKFFSDGSPRPFPVFFDNPIKVDPEVPHIASVIVDGKELSYFGQDGLPEVSCGDVTFQFHCSQESTNGTGVQGGQIPEIIFYRLQ